ncbi:MAG: cytochrome C, partial [Magnetovibrio sp.]|nr:cytochrome C [Magnetovibrio sp.]
KRGPAAVVGGSYESDMPGFDGVLTDAEIVAVLSYIKSTWPASIRARHDDLNQRAQADGK